MKVDSTDMLEKSIKTFENVDFNNFLFHVKVMLGS